MSDSVVIVPNGDAIYAVPTDVCIKYKLEGKELEGAQAVLTESDGDVTGQYHKNSRGEAYTWDYSSNGYVRSPQWD